MNDHTYDLTQTKYMHNGRIFEEIQVVYIGQRCLI